MGWKKVVCRIRRQIVRQKNMLRRIRRQTLEWKNVGSRKNQKTGFGKRKRSPAESEDAKWDSKNGKRWGGKKLPDKKNDDDDQRLKPKL